jgi:hypothetical protein
MAAKRFKSLFRGAGRNALDLPVAGLSALAAAFAAFAIPQDILSRAVIATGLPRLVSAAQPPLGLTARVALAVGGAAIVFGLVLLTLRLLDRSGLNGAEERQETQSGPRVRRRDGHPDAPTPRPISAARDLGEPAPPRAPRAEVPVWLDEAEPTPPAFGAPPEPVVAQMPEPEPEPEVDLVLEPEAQAEPEPWHAPEPVVFPGPEPRFVPEPEPVSVLAVEPEPEPEPEPAVAEAVPPVPVPAPRADMPTSIAELMERLEQGLARRKMIEPEPLPEAPQAVAEAPAVAEEPEAFDVPEVPAQAEAADDRLQSAIASLQRLAARSA